MELEERLAVRRATVALGSAHPEVTFSLLHWVIGTWANDAAREVFQLGATLLAGRYQRAGLHQLLPIDRVWVGIRSTRPDSFGGFHHPDQGYRHLQLASMITRYGRLVDPAVVSPELVALDLLRSYAHDCLHFGSFREYRLQQGTVIRSRYGINRRDDAGRTYSAPDQPGSLATRNIGIVMEGATDREARSVAREVAARLGLAEPAAPLDRLAFQDTTGRLGPADFTGLPDRSDAGGAARYQWAMAGYERGVGGRYARFLTETGGEHAEVLHGLIVAAMIAGDVRALLAWLDERHGRGAFRRIFRSPVYTGPDPGE
ncbi:hypothetical protein [Streptacidiphilus sp. P02-A3a]|uniref:hypothetical protein n=1 Tax=Streptacidiphilus sp. P02-A3a TaxID=2704468 RepID=UPI0015FA5589|nr:hypothetical protein [Streptacidiphilus sp. P02-A3a]QMU68006.1 hypothetical protein GXP74_07035 [Streptacidiphilus sp. P02-A3a]